MAYERVNWENLPSKNTPVNADNLNKMDEGIKDLETELSKKANSADFYNKTDIDKKMNALDSNKINFSYLTDYANGIARKIRVTNVDFNSLATYQSGLITILDATANAPVNMSSNSHWYVLQIYTNEGADFITQIATYFFDYDDIYIRNCTNGTWGAWRKIINNIQENYSTNEVKIGTWINGKPIYRQTFGFNVSNLGTETYFNWTDSFYNENSISNVDEIINVKSFYKRSDNSYEPVPNNHSQPSHWACGIYDFSGTGFRFWVGDSNNAFTINYLIVTIEYTKTTD